MPTTFSLFSYAAVSQGCRRWTGTSPPVNLQLHPAALLRCFCSACRRFPARQISSVRRTFTPGKPPSPCSVRGVSAGCGAASKVPQCDGDFPSGKSAIASGSAAPMFLLRLPLFSRSTAQSRSPHIYSGEAPVPLLCPWCSGQFFTLHPSPFTLHSSPFTLHSFNAFNSLVSAGTTWKRSPTMP